MTAVTPAYNFHWTEQITKAIVILVLAPLILYKAVIYHDLTLGLIGALMLLYDGYWAVKYKLVQRDEAKAVVQQTDECPTPEIPKTPEIDASPHITQTPHIIQTPHNTQSKRIIKTQ